MFFKKKSVKRTFDDVLSSLGAQKFDVSAAGEGANGKRVAGAYRVSKYGCAAEIAPSAAIKEKIVPPPAPAEIVTRAGFLLNGQIAALLDRGYQKFLKTPKLEIVATADHLRAIHQFSAELDEATGATMLYNESLGTTSDVYQYDRVKGREVHGEHSADALQRSPTASGTEAASDL
jgi:hypothetical protein